MKRVFTSLLLMVLMCGVFPGCSRNGGHALDPDLARYVAEKRAQLQVLADSETNTVPASVWAFFDAVQRDDFLVASNQFEMLKTESGRHGLPRSPTPVPATWDHPLSFVVNLLHALGLGKAPPPPATLTSAAWTPILETLGTYEQFHEWSNKWLHRYGRDMIDVIPSNSIYFGGTDPGRFVISALGETYPEDRRFFIITQNALADGTYLDYLRTLYGAKLYIPTPGDAQRAFSDYIADAQERLKAGKLDPGEDVSEDNGRVQVSGQTAVMKINASLAKVIVDKNPGHEFIVEESFPLDWMYPYLSPDGLILKLNPEPLTELPDEVVQKDHDYWAGYLKELVGGWLTDQTTVAEVCDFAEKVYLKKDLTGFTGDADFVRDEEARKCYSKMRSAIGGLYAWRAKHSASAAEKARMVADADLAFRQALAICPSSPETVFRYVDLLQDQNRTEDSLKVAEMASHLNPTNASTRDLVARLKTLLPNH